MWLFYFIIVLNSVVSCLRNQTGIPWYLIKGPDPGVCGTPLDFSSPSRPHFLGEISPRPVPVLSSSGPGPAAVLPKAFQQYPRTIPTY